MTIRKLTPEEVDELQLLVECEKKLNQYNADALDKLQFKTKLVQGICKDHAGFYQNLVNQYQPVTDKTQVVTDGPELYEEGLTEEDLHPMAGHLD